MEVKKTKRASLEKSKSVFTLVGMIMTLSLVWFAFEYKVYDKADIEGFGTTYTSADQDVILQTERIKRPPPPPIQPTTIIDIVKNTKEVKDDLVFDVETNKDDIIALQVVDEEEEETVIEEPIFVFVEDQPEYPGGDKARLTFLSNAITYPELAKETGIQGVVHLTFVVEKSGEISNVELLRGIGGGCDEAAIEAIKRMPNWKPGKQRGRAVRTQFKMPVKFFLAG